MKKDFEKKKDSGFHLFEICPPCFSSSDIKISKESMEGHDPVIRQMLADSEKLELTDTGVAYVRSRRKE